MAAANVMVMAAATAVAAAMLMVAALFFIVLCHDMWETIFSRLDDARRILGGPSISKEVWMSIMRSRWSPAVPCRHNTGIRNGDVGRSPYPINW